jgi:hypothetical protein
MQPAGLDWAPVWTAPALTHTRVVPVLRKAVVAAPDRLDLRLLLARALAELDDLGAIIELLAPHARNDYGGPELAYLFGRACARTNDTTRALPALRCAVDAGVVAAHGELAWILIGEAADADALAVCRKAFELGPADAKTVQAAAHVLLAQDGAEELLDLCQMLRERGHCNSQIPAIWAVAAAAAGRHDEARRLVDRDRWFAQRELAVDAEFNRRLADEILQHRMSVGAEHSYYSTRGDAIRLWAPEAVGGNCAQQLVSMIRDEIDFYVSEHAPFADHPAMAGHPARVRLHTWALTLRNDGHEQWHIHPAGWLSGVYYVAIPEMSPPPAGAIGFGPYPIKRWIADLDFPRWDVQPEVGQLLIFPSYFTHRTWPTGTTEPRICVSFDVVAAKPSTNAVFSSPPLAP